ncbi:ABC transporter substrate-binding protein [Halalkalibacter nanhaiisediminis]|uniref:Peptide/nickel transport system substrate-binding protein n=1 Tax=Halalkalibacter nanhaiisediminis TaxID=688079 RepID=A0A562QNC3_9BACI|nr:ABC transporter substrate-binding protein [Halalkalibacter nanhaiisediminis]TWI58195.1 peptide/nickel transport system substrate-binding protein [Halalkalibacter nanhaiisediminis]
MKSKAIGLIYILVISMFMIGCSSDSTSQNEEEESEVVTGGDIRVAMNASPPTLDPHMTTATATSEVSRHIFETLLTLNSNYEVVPMLAESFEQSEDGLTTTFELRQGVTFHNGKEMTSADVVASMESWLIRSGKSESTFSGTTFEAEGDYTVIMNLETPSIGALHTMAAPTQFSAIMPKEIIESAPAQGVDEFIGTGPFEFVEWKQDQYIHLQKFENYQSLDANPDGLAGKREALVDNVYFDVVTDDSTRVAGLTTGQYQVGLWLPRDNYDQLSNTPNVVTSVDLYGPQNLIFNKAEGVFTDPLMRQAINAVLNKDEIMLAAFADEVFYRLDHGLMYQEQLDWYSEAGQEYYNQNDQDLAQQLLQEAGYNGEEIRILTSRDYDHIYNTSVVVQQQLEEAGINASLEVYDWATVVQKRSEPSEYDAFITGFVTVTDPTQIVTLDPSWPGFTDDETIRDLLENIRVSTSQEEAKAYFEELQEYNWSTYLTHIKIGDFSLLTGYRNNVEGINFFEGIVLWNTTVH